MEIESKKCPNCRLINPSSAQLCDCGYDFDAEVLPESAKQKTPPKAAVLNKFALIFTMIIIWALAYGAFQGTGYNLGAIGTFIAIAPILYA